MSKDLMPLSMKSMLKQKISGRGQKLIHMTVHAAIKDQYSCAKRSRDYL